MALSFRSLRIVFFSFYTMQKKHNSIDWRITMNEKISGINILDFAYEKFKMVSPKSLSL